MSSAEIAEVLQCSEGAVEQRLVRARAALRERSQS
jgi:DNA-directed RNA polymerase specialized sigma24 family protein